MMSWWRRLQFLRSGEREMQEELRSIREMADGAELGNLTYAAEEARSMWRFNWLDELLRDARYTLRLIARQPGYAAVAVLSLGLGIGANAAIYGLIDRLLWRQLPVREPGRLVRLENSRSYFTLQQFASKSGEMFEGVIGTTGTMERELSTGAEGRPGHVEMVSGNFFQVLGVPAAIGRTLAPEDDIRGQSSAAAVLSYGYWKQAFGGDPTVLGRQIRAGNVTFTIIGVAAPEFFGIAVGSAADVWLPLTRLHEVFPRRRWLDDRGASFMDIVARLRPGITPERAAVALTPLSVSIELERAGREAPDWRRMKIESEQLHLLPAAQGVSELRQRFSKPLQALFALVGIVLLLACVNVMGLQFARAGERRRELHVRLAIGAGRGRVMRQLLTESLVLALAGGVLGLAIYRPAAAAVVSFVTLSGDPVRLPLEIDGSMLLFVLVSAVAATVISGVLPALRATRPEPLTAPAATGGRARRTLGRTVVSVQMALSLILIAGAFLFGFSLYRLTHFETGIDRSNLLVADVDTRQSGYTAEQIAGLNLRIFERLRGMNRVEAVSFSSNGIYAGRNSNTQIVADGFHAEPGPERHAFFDEVGPSYFTTLRTRILTGREFNDRDVQPTARVAVVSQSFARHFFPDGDPVGRNIHFSDPRNVPIQVIGVVEDIRYNLREAPRRTFYLPVTRTNANTFFSTRFTVRTRMKAAELHAAIRAEDKGIRVLSIDSADGLLARTLDLDRLIAMLSFAFGILAVVLAAVGVYGLLAYDVARRTGEIGIRMALGATGGRVMAMVLREAVYVGAAGMVVGIAAAAALGKLARGLVFGIAPGDPMVLACAAALLGSVAIGAAWIPARRASRLDPMTALRHD